MSFCLTNFVPVRMIEPVPQALTLELSAYRFAKSYCRSHGITDAESFGTIIHETRQKFEKFALSPLSDQAAPIGVLSASQRHQLQQWRVHGRRARA